MRAITIPLQLINLQDDGFHLLVEVVVFNESHHCVVDTGASRTVFDQSLIEKHTATKIKTINDINAATLFSTTTTSQANIPLLQIGTLKIKHYQTVGLDLQSVSQTYQQFGYPPIAGIIGGDILMQYQATINYAKMWMRLYR